MKKLMLVLFFAAVVFAGCQKKEAPVATDGTATNVVVSTEVAATPAVAK
ncbi:MAG: hypothetical protein M0Q46_01675 [Endomicrobiales bacterium]|nr:hypothetical protein [Endomicrobiales bacterium]